MEPRLVDVRTPSAPGGIVLVLHGGADRPGGPPVSPTQLSVIRMVPIARRLARAGRRRLAVHRLLNSHRGWNTAHPPVDDVAWALDRLRARHPGVPIALVGHSLGGRAALLAGGEDDVRVVVALNPWLYPDDGVPLPGRQVLIVHGDADRIAPMSRSRAVADRLAASAEVTYEVVPDGTHAMLRHARRFEDVATAFVVDGLLET